MFQGCLKLLFRCGIGIHQHLITALRYLLGAIWEIGRKSFTAACKLGNYRAHQVTTDVERICALDLELTGRLSLANEFLSGDVCGVAVQSIKGGPQVSCQALDAAEHIKGILMGSWLPQTNM